MFPSHFWVRHWFWFRFRRWFGIWVRRAESEKPHYHCKSEQELEIHDGFVDNVSVDQKLRIYIHFIYDFSCLWFFATGSSQIESGQWISEHRGLYYMLKIKGTLAINQKHLQFNFVLKSFLFTVGVKLRIKIFKFLKTSLKWRDENIKKIFKIQISAALN